MLLKLDAFLLQQMQKFCDKLQVLTGLTKFFVAKWLLIFSLSGLCFFSSSWIEAIAAALIACTAPGVVREFEEHEKQFFEKGILYHWPSELHLFSLCLFGAAGILVLLVGLTGLGGFYLFFVALVYAGSCTPRPPSKSKMRQWYESALIWANDLLAPRPVPIPISGG